MYPRVRELLPDLEDDVLESYEEHHVADLLVVELAALEPTAERFEAKTTVLIENVRHHMDEEEQESPGIPLVRDAGSLSGHTAGGAGQLGLVRTTARELGAWG